MESAAEIRYHRLKVSIAQVAGTGNALLVVVKVNKKAGTSRNYRSAVSIRVAPRV